MKRFFISAIVTMGCFMAHAQSVTIPEVSIVPGGEKSVDVTIAEGTKYTAFQFDVALPTGVSLKSASFKGKGATREITSGKVDGKYRVLSYDTKNEKLGGTEVLSLTFAATNEFTTDAETAVDGIVIVDPEGNSAKTTNGTVAVKVGEGVSVTIGANKVTTLVSDKDLDFSDAAISAYIATGYNYSNDNILLTRVKDVPANTPILVMGEPSGDTPYVIPVGTSRIYYPENFLKGNATTKAPVDHSGKYINMLLKDGKFSALASSVTEYTAGKCYLQIPASVATTAGTALEFTMGSNGVKSYTGRFDLDFTNVDGLSAYVVTGYDKNNTIWLTRVKKVSANTPLVLLGDANKPYEVPSTAQQASYVNMLRGDANNATTITPENGEWTNLILLKGTFKGLPVESYDVPAGASYLPIPSSIIAAARGEFVNDQQYNMAEAEVITMKAFIGGEGDNTTGISHVASEVVNDVWYNLKGQRIDAPTRKGLYIKNGKKVVVK